MKRTILSVLLLGLSCTLMAREPDEMELTLVEKVKWCQLEGQKLYSEASENKNPPLARKMYFDGAMKFFQLERQYMEDLRWHCFFADLKESMNDCDCDCDDDVSVNLGQIIKQIKSK